MTTLIGPALTSLAVALALTPVLRWMSHRHELLDVPNERSSHARPTPRSGGVAIIAGVVVALALFGEWRDARLLFVLVWGAIIALLGLVDDFRALPAKPKLAVHVLTAVATTVLADVTLQRLKIPFHGWLELSVLAIPITLFWIVGVTNAYNFMDGINGMASVEAIVCGAAYAVLTSRAGDHGGATLALAIAGGAAGFLVWNAGGSIFMGDVGSGVLGFLFAVLALRLAWWDVPFLAAMLPLFPFLFDTGLTLVRRARRRERLFMAHRTHMYQRLTALGWSHPAVSSLWGALAAGCAAGALAWSRMGDAGRIAMLLGIAAVHVCIAISISAVERRRDGASVALPPRDQPS